MNDRDRIMEQLLRNPAARLDGHVEALLADPEFRARLHRYDRDRAQVGNDNAEPERLVR
jgi:hypothetical protein